MTTIAVYADWIGLPQPLRLGMLEARRGAGREVFEFSFDAAALVHPATANLHLDPRLGLFEGRQHPPQGQPTFGVFADASPDRWGPLLMRRRLERAQRTGEVGPAVRLRESDCLRGVHDTYRSGALRLRLDDVGDFLDNCHGVAAPPFVQLRELEAASLALERDEDVSIPAVDDWLRLLIAPGGSLGGAGPKASDVDPDGQLWIAKFPSVRDEHDVDGWELVVQTLALRDLWSRIVFNMLVSNSDDHLHNHGFLLVPGKGWRLSEVYDMNPVPASHGLKLNVGEADNALDLDLARSVTP